MRRTEYTLYIPNWRCGDDNENVSLGIGDTEMLNEEGFMCCLGQFASNVGVRENDLLEAGSPMSVAFNAGFVTYDSNFVIKDEDSPYEYINTELSERLMDINDSTCTTPAKKVELIREELSRYGIKLNVVDPNNQLGGDIE